MGKINIELRPESGQRSVSRIHQGVCGDIIHRSDPFALEDSPQCLSYIKMRTVWGKKEEEQPAFLPYGTQSLNELTSVHAGIVKHHECVLVDVQRHTVKKICYPFSRHVLCCGETMISVVPVDHAKEIESGSPLRRDMHVLITELPSIRDVTFGAYMALIPVIEVNESGNGLMFEFLQLLGLIRIELRRGLTLGTFPYTSISRANADKKALKVLSLASLPEDCCQASFAFLTLCLSFSMAMRTASSSEQSIIGLRPRPGRVSNPRIPSVSKRFTQELTDIWVISVCEPTCSEVRPVDFRSTARQRIRKAWLLPLRKPSSNCRRCWSVSCITLIFAIVVSVYADNAQTYAKILI